MTFSAFVTTLLYAAMQIRNWHKTELSYLDTETNSVDHRLFQENSLDAQTQTGKRKVIHSLICMSQRQPCSILQIQIYTTQFNIISSKKLFLCLIKASKLIKIKRLLCLPKSTDIFGRYVQTLHGQFQNFQGIGMAI